MAKHKKGLTEAQLKIVRAQQELARKGLRFDADFGKLPQHIREELAAAREKKRRWWQW